MASKDDNTFSTDTQTTDASTTDALSFDKALDPPGGAAAPVKKAVAKRAPRKATKKASAPQHGLRLR